MNAVIKAPLSLPASTTSRLLHHALISIFLSGKLYVLGAVPGGYSDITAPL